MSQQPDQTAILAYRVEQVEHALGRKVESRELGLQLTPIHREMTAIRAEITILKQELADRDEKQRKEKEEEQKKQQEEKEKQYKWILRAIWAAVVAILSFASGVLLLVIQHWIG
ncbi:hypothetical protein KSF_096090 [Reticulibacter mediterranei]|uniref:Uncharacterized protein n=1 Tax=Reticulibacter mediterranei TaxID=2778369 RepID=A0A8J3J2H0_9CHLR|nr:hypothetical protein [Reticulibacter mediterranei]GHO99561.1 hypothetical protein KSF_096090 [Reticulibacter mediterranei]